MSDDIILVTGGFDPLHSGHISYINSAKELGRVVVGLNSDDWLKRKKGSHFMSFYERHSVISNLKNVTTVIGFNDIDGTACDAIEKTKQLFPKNKIIFANGGDRTSSNIPELIKYSNDSNVEFKFGIGGEDKKNSSSWILENWKSPKTQRPWGYYRVLHNVSGCKVKELTVDPGKSLSMQKHSGRSELWFVSEGACHIKQYPNNTSQAASILPIQRHQTISIPVGFWHQLHNPYETPCKIVEIQYGEFCEESDIIRMEN